MSASSNADEGKRELMKAKDLKGLAVVSLDAATRLGRVEDLFFDTAQLRVMALEMSQGGQRAAIPFSEIRAIGRDAVTIDNSQGTQMASAGNPVAHLPRLDQVTKLKIVDESGSLLGTITDFEFDQQSGQLERLEGHRGGTFGIGGTTFHVPAQAIRSVGAEMIVVVPPNSSTPA